MGMEFSVGVGRKLGWILQKASGILIPPPSDYSICRLAIFFEGNHAQEPNAKQM